VTATSRWGARAADLYGEGYARRYRGHDDAIRNGALVTKFGGWLGSVCDGFGRPIDVLDMGCGTGRYFHALRRVRHLVGIDVSRSMLEQARQPVGGAQAPAGAVTLIQGDFLVHAFDAAEFDLVYSIGVLAEHSPFDAALSARVRRWLRPAGRFMFTAVHPRSFSVPRTIKRRMAETILPLTRGLVRGALRARLMSDGLYADEERLRDVLTSTGFAVESIELYESDVHLHALVVAKGVE
jgi:ubiquinone/menaquinone biosynthesis C-methylase UbiE